MHADVSVCGCVYEATWGARDVTRVEGFGHSLGHCDIFIDLQLWPYIAFPVANQKVFPCNLHCIGFSAASALFYLI